MGSFGLWLSRGAQSTAVTNSENDHGKTAQGSRVGVGLVMEVDESSGNIYISDLILNSAAWHSSLCIGDRITHIDNVPVKGKLAAAVNDLLLGEEGSVLELRVEARAVADGGKMVSLCKPARRSELKTLRLMRGRGALQKQIQQEGTIQVAAAAAAPCAGKLAVLGVCVPTEHVVYTFALALRAIRWDLHKRYSDFVHMDRRLRSAFSDAKLDLVLGPSRLPGKAYLDKSSARLIDLRKRRLEMYLRALVSHRAMARSDLVRNFLQLPDELYSHPQGGDAEELRAASPAGSSESVSVASVGSDDDPPLLAAPPHPTAAATPSGRGSGWGGEGEAQARRRAAASR